MVQMDPLDEVMMLRSEGLADSVILSELTQKGYSPQQVKMALAQTAPEEVPLMPTMPSGGSQQMPLDSEQSNIYDRIEEMTENLVDEKWDELIVEVKKIVEWKEKIEESQRKMQADLDTLKENFNVLHQGVLGKLEDYDTRMRDVGTELKAVGKVFKDVVPQFVENVKELKGITERVKK